MTRERFREIVEGIAKITGCSDLKRLSGAISMHHEIEEILNRPEATNEE